MQKKFSNRCGNGRHQRPQSYAQVVTDKCEPNLDNQHQTYPNMAQQKICSIEGQSSNKTTNVVGKHVQSTCSSGKNSLKIKSMCKAPVNRDFLKGFFFQTSKYPTYNIPHKKHRWIQPGLHKESISNSCRQG